MRLDHSSVWLQGENNLVLFVSGFSVQNGENITYSKFQSQTLVKEYVLMNWDLIWICDIVFLFLIPYTLAYILGPGFRADYLAFVRGWLYLLCKLGLRGPSFQAYLLCWVGFIAGRLRRPNWKMTTGWSIFCTCHVWVLNCVQAPL